MHGQLLTNGLICSVVWGKITSCAHALVNECTNSNSNDIEEVFHDEIISLRSLSRLAEFCKVPAAPPRLGNPQVDTIRV